MTFPNPHAVLVDMDGTLVDTEGLWHLAEIDTMLTLGSDWTVEDQAHALGGPLERVTRYMIAKSGSSRTPDEVGALLIDAVDRHLVNGDVTFTPGTQALLDSLQDDGIPMALVSASPRRLVDRVMQILGSGHFETTVAGGEAPRSKPAPDPYLLAASRLGVDPARCVVLEDSPTGVAAGLASGGVVVAIPHLVPIAPGPRLVVVESLLDVTPDHVREWLASA